MRERGYSLKEITVFTLRVRYKEKDYYIRKEDPEKDNFNKIYKDRQRRRFYH